MVYRIGGALQEWKASGAGGTRPAAVTGSNPALSHPRRAAKTLETPASVWDEQTPGYPQCESCEHIISRLQNSWWSWEQGGSRTDECNTHRLLLHRRVCAPAKVTPAPAWVPGGKAVGLGGPGQQMGSGCVAGGAGAGARRCRGSAA